HASLTALAHDDAVRLFVQALHLLPPGNSKSRAEMLTQLARAQWLAGDHALASSTSDLAWQAAIECDDPASLAEAALGTHFGFRFEDPGAAQRAHRLT